MVKAVVLAVVVLSGLFGGDSYERNCVVCHKGLSVSLQEMFMNYLLVYGGERNVKAGLKHYLQYPSKSLSVMSPLFIKLYGVKEPTLLSSKEIDEALDTYWERYKVFGRVE
jgi:hypothetical protein